MRIITMLLLVLLPFGLNAEAWEARYGTQFTFPFKLYNADGTLDVDEADGGTEVSVRCSGGTNATATNDFADKGSDYEIVLTATEMQCATVIVTVAATTTEVFFIQTLNNASAGIPTINSNLLTVEGTDATDVLGTAQTGDAFARLGAPAGASHAADLVVIDNFVDDLESRLGTPSNLGGGATVAQNLSDIEAQTDDIGAAGAGLTVLATQASVNTVDDFLDTEVAAILAAVDTEVAAILDDTGTTGVVMAEVTANCREVFGCDTQGTLSGTHSTTTADLGTNAPANDVTGMTLVIPSRNFSRAVTAYNTGTGVATFETTGVTLANSDQYYLHATAPGGAGGGLDAAGVRAAVGLASANLDTQLATIDTNVDDIETDTSTTLDDLVDDLESRLGTPSNLGSGATVAANLSDIEGFADNLPTDPADESNITALITAVDDFVDTEIATLTTRLGTPTDFGSGTSSIAANLQDLADNGTAAFDRATDSLQAIRDRGDAAWTGGGGGSADWTSDERDAMRAIFGIPPTGTTPADPTTGILDTIRNSVATRSSQASLDTIDDLVDDLEGRLTGTRAGYLDNLSAGAVATASALSAVDDFVDTEIATLLTNVNTVDDFVDTEIAGLVTTIGAAGAGLTAADDAVMTRLGAPAGASVSADIAAVLTTQRIISGTCDSGSTTTCVDDALTQAAAAQLQDRLVCFDDSWCAMITTFAPGSDTVTTTKVAPSTRASKAYTIFPATVE